MAVATLREARARRRQAIVASGMPVDSKIDGEMLRRLEQPWQIRSFVYYNLIPEVWYAGGFYSRHMSRIELRVEELNDDGDWVRVEDATAPEVEFLDRIQDERGGRTVMLGAYGRLRFLVGECYLICFDPNTEDEKWEILSKREFRPRQDGKGYERIRFPGAQPEPVSEAADIESPTWEQVPESAWVWRLWRRHPEFSMEADSPMRAVQDVCEELLLLTLAVRAGARSRIARSGLLLMPNEISQPPISTGPNDDALDDPFLRTLIEHMEAPLKDEGSAASVVPLVVRGPMAALDKLRQLILHTSGDYPEKDLRTECIQRFANGVDMPPEVLLGTGDVNHWGAWQIDQQTWEAHIQPVVEEFCEELSATVFRPSLEQSGIALAIARRRRIWYDPVKIVNHPDRGKDAQDVFDRGEIGGAALRLAKGFDEDDAPTDSERARWIGVRVRDGGLAWYGEPTLKAGATGETGEPLPGDTGTGGEDDTGGEVPPEQGGTGNDVNAGSPADANQEAARLLGAAEAALLQCRKTAGSRIIQRLPRSERAKYARIPKHQLYSHVSADDLQRYLAAANGDGTPAGLVRGGTEAFEECLRAWGYPPERVQALSGYVQEHAARTLADLTPATFAPILFNL